MERLFGFIDDHEMRRECEQTVQEVLSEYDSTFLTNTYYEQESNSHILQLSTYQNDQLLAMGIEIPEANSEEIDLLEVIVDDGIRALENRKV